MRTFLRVVALSGTLAAASATLAQPEYRIIDLTEIANVIGVVQSQADAVNNDGVIIGWEAMDLAIDKPLLWRADLTPIELPKLLGDNSARPIDIADNGLILGVSDEVIIKVVGHQIRIFQDMKAVTWTSEVVSRVDSMVTGGEPTDLRMARGINTAGTMIGYGNVPGANPPAIEPKGWTLENGIVGDLGELEFPYAINTGGEIVGSTFGSQEKAYHWVGGVLTNLHNHPRIGGVVSQAFDINDNGLIVGRAQFDISKPEEAAMWRAGEPFRLIPDITRPQGVASAINGQGQVVGYFNDLDKLNEGWRGFVWENGQRRELLQLIDPAEGWTELLAFDINDCGIIVGGGRRFGEIGHAWVMIPEAGCYADCDQSGVLDIFDFLCFQNSFVAGEPYACECDLDPVCNIFDFLCFQNACVGGCP